MYKVFVNHKPLTLSSQKLESVKNIPFQTDADMDVAMDLLEHKEPAVNVYSDNLELLWKVFQSRCKIIYAAGGLVKNKDGEFLFIYRLGNWDLPKGKMEKGESIPETATREVEEECGITHLTIEKPLDDTYHTYFLKGERVLKITYWFLMDYTGDETLVPQTEEGIERVEWIAKEKVATLLQNTYPNIKALVHAFFE